MGAGVGTFVGEIGVGCGVGFVGDFVVGDPVGMGDFVVGDPVGVSVGDPVGVNVGAIEGDFVGAKVGHAITLLHSGLLYPSIPT